MMVKIKKLRFLTLLQNNSFSFSKETISKIINLIEHENAIKIVQYGEKFIKEIKSKILSVKKSWKKVNGGHKTKKLKEKYQLEFFLFKLSSTEHFRTEIFAKKNNRINLVNRYLKKMRKKSLLCLTKSVFRQNKNFLNNENQIDIQIDQSNNKNIVDLADCLLYIKEKYFIKNKAFSEFRKYLNAFPSNKYITQKFRSIDNIFLLNKIDHNFFYSFERKFLFYFESLEKTNSLLCEAVLIVENQIINKYKNLKKNILKVSFILLNDPNYNMISIGLFDYSKRNIFNFIDYIDSEIIKIKNYLKNYNYQIKFYLMPNFNFQNIFNETNKTCIWCCDKGQNRLSKIFDSIVIKRSIFFNKCILTLLEYLISDIFIGKSKNYESDDLNKDKFLSLIEKECFKLNFFERKGKKFRFLAPSECDKKKFLTKFCKIDFNDKNISELQQIWKALNEIFLVFDERNLEDSEKYQIISKQISIAKKIFNRYYHQKKFTPYLHFLFNHLEKMSMEKNSYLFKFFLNWQNESIYSEYKFFFQSNPELFLKKLNRLEFLKFKI